MTQTKPKPTRRVAGFKPCEGRKTFKTSEVCATKVVKMHPSGHMWCEACGKKRDITESEFYEQS